MAVWKGLFSKSAFFTSNFFSLLKLDNFIAQVKEPFVFTLTPVADLKSEVNP